MENSFDLSRTNDKISLVSYDWPVSANTSNIQCSPSVFGASCTENVLEVLLNCCKLKNEVRIYVCWALNKKERKLKLKNEDIRYKI